MQCLEITAYYRSIIKTANDAAQAMSEPNKNSAEPFAETLSKEIIIRRHAIIRTAEKIIRSIDIALF